MSERLLRMSEVMNRVGLRRTAIYDKISRDEFPHPIKLGNASRWVESEVDAWIAAAVASHRKAG
ncbi:helix-turn-helix transcriptional regulator [Marinobacter sp.]|uniref:helix-turn-helix transcriptional regulator n=1 Tax=Marinobacter sp. TaxID=50741 RepID=UPI003A8FA46F